MNSETDSDGEPAPLVPPVESSTSISDEAIRKVAAEIEREAGTHGRNYAAGMREARRIVEETLSE